MNLEQKFQTYQAQFANLDIKRIPEWPSAPRYSVIVVAVVALCGLWFTQYFSEQVTVLEEAKQAETGLKDELQGKFAKAATLPLLREQSKVAAEQLVKLDALLPPNEQIPQMLSQVNQLGLLRELRFGLFQPEKAVEKDGFGFVPVKLQMKGKFSELTRFVGDIAGQKRMMMFDNFHLTFQQAGDVLLEGRLLAFKQNSGNKTANKEAQQ